MGGVDLMPAWWESVFYLNDLQQNSALNMVNEFQYQNSEISVRFNIKGTTDQFCNFFVGQGTCAPPHIPLDSPLPNIPVQTLHVPSQPSLDGPILTFSFTIHSNAIVANKALKPWQNCCFFFFC